jgi:hypothetical protein
VTKDDLKTLLNGRGFGASLFIAWALGVFATFPLMVLFTSLSANFYGVWRGFIASLFLFSIWQAILILPSFRKRVLWISISAATILPVLHIQQFKGTTGFWHLLSIGMILQSLLLVGVRKRFWLWVILAVVGNPAHNFLSDTIYGYYKDLFAAILRVFPGIPKILIPSLIPTYVMVLTVIVGAVTSFLMPLVGSAAANTQAKP